MHTLRSAALLCPLLLTVLALVAARADEVPAPAAYTVELDGASYTVLSADVVDGYRVQLADGRVIGIPAADPAAPLTAEAIAAALANPPAPPPLAPVWTALAFFERFTEGEQLAIFASEDAAVRLFRAKLLAAQEVRADDPRTVAALDLLVSKGLLTTERKAAILAP